VRRSRGGDERYAPPDEQRQKWEHWIDYKTGAYDICAVRKPERNQLVLHFPFFVRESYFQD